MKVCATRRLICFPFLGFQEQFSNDQLSVILFLDEDFAVLLRSLSQLSLCLVCVRKSILFRRGRKLTASDSGLERLDGKDRDFCLRRN